MGKLKRPKKDLHCMHCGSHEEDWQDADRTMTPVELSKWGPGWIDN